MNSKTLRQLWAEQREERCSECGQLQLGRNRNEQWFDNFVINTLERSGLIEPSAPLKRQAPDSYKERAVAELLALLDEQG